MRTKTGVRVPLGPWVKSPIVLIGSFGPDLQKKEVMKRLQVYIIHVPT